MKEFVLTLFCLTLLSLSSGAQTYDSLYVNPDIRPQYPTNDPGFYEDLTNQITNLLNPYLIQQMSPNGYRAIIGFVVNAEGKIDSVFHDNRSDHFYLQDQIHQSYYLTQPWSPGRDQGEAVNTLVYMEFVLLGSDPVWELAFQPLYPNSVVLANTEFDKKWTKWAVLGVIATVGIFYLLTQL